MPEKLHGFPFWGINFDDQGVLNGGAPEASLLAEIAAENLTDLFIFSHGWNNSAVEARRLNEHFFGEVRLLLDDMSFPRRRIANLGLMGVVWPAVLWPDELPGVGGPAASQPFVPHNEVFAALRKIVTTAGQALALDRLKQLLSQQKSDESSLHEFLEVLRGFIDPENTQQESTEAPQEVTDTIELRGIVNAQQDWREILDMIAEGEVFSTQGGSARLGDPFAKLWTGARGALRIATYWLMKDRAGRVGREGLGPLIGRLHQRINWLRVHLIGHSFGARLVSFALAGLPEPEEQNHSAVKSLYLIQGAFSHFAFADTLPFDSRRGGDLKGMTRRVDGPLVATFSDSDSAVGRAYPLASVVARQDASAAQPLRWGAMGSDGAQAVGASHAFLGKAGAAYPFQSGQWTNLDASRVIVNGGPPSGSHSDIVHAHTAWVALVAAGLR